MEATLARAEELLERREVEDALREFGAAELGGADADRCSGGRWMCQMLLGYFEAAWREADALRGRRAPDPHRFWNGESVAGKRVMLRSLHGCGDAVQMLRYVPLLRVMCAELILEVAPKLVEIARCVAGVGRVITWGEKGPETPPVWDVQIEVMELPYFFRMTVQALPIATEYVVVPNVVTGKVRSLMGRRTAPRIGVVWSAGEWNPERGLPFRFVERLAAETRCEFWSLQGGAAQTQWRSLPRAPHLRDAAECGDGIVTLAALMEQMDLVITVDTLAAHLAGALGVPAWVLLQQRADWRWMLERDDSPWYPSLRLHRQPAQGDWQSLMEMVEMNLRIWLEEGCRDDRRA